MAGDAKKIAVFTALLEENRDNWIAHYQQDLLALQQQVDDDDEKNASGIQEFLDKFPDIHRLYEDKLQSIAVVRNSTDKADTKGFAGSQPQPNSPSPSLGESLKNAMIEPKPIPKKYNDSKDTDKNL